MKRFSFSLLEVLIALPLALMLILSLTQNFSLLTQSNKKLDQRYEKALERHYFQRRLQYILSRVTEQKIKHEFFKPKAIEFNFDNGKSLQDQASGKVYAKFCLDTQSQELVLLLYDQKTEIRKEILLSQVADLELSYWFEYSEKRPGLTNPFVTTQDTAQSDQHRWVALEAKVWRMGAPNSENYFFTLERSHSSVH